MPEVKIEGLTVDEILSTPDGELDALVFTAAPLIFRAGSAEVLGQFAIRQSRLVAELAHIDGGGEGALPTITKILKAVAKRRDLGEIEWLVYATNCARPNPNLLRVLQRRGFKVESVPAVGECYRLLERLL